MPAGCDFICKNRTCKCFEQGFTITEPWPMGRIELVLNAPNVKRNPDFRKKLIDLKNNGRKFACITYPNLARIDIDAYRVHLWSEDAQCVWQYDIETAETEDDEDTIDSSDLPEKCPKTGGELLGFNEVIQEKICCAHCGITLQQDRWFTNEE